jgi:uncharacterized membrane protein YphA (DoxX/SURF4 family)
MIVVLRMAIGWQLFYEGVWKMKTLRSPKPWTSAGYLKNSQGPMRATFRRMTGDPDELDWLDTKKVTQRWRDWQKRFTRHYGLSNKQKARLDQIVNGRKAFYSDSKSVKAIPESIDLDRRELTYPTSEKLTITIKQLPSVKKKVVQEDSGELRKDDILEYETTADLEKDFKSSGTELIVRRPTRKPIVSYDAENQRLVVDGRRHMDASEYGRFLKYLPKADEDNETEATFRKQLEKVYLRASRLSYVEKLRASLLGDSEWVGNKKNLQVGELQKYRDMLADYEVAAAKADQDFEFDHLQKLWADLQTQRSSLVGPIKSLEDSMKDDAEELLTTKQAASGAVPKPWTSLRIADSLTIAGLTLLGLCLIAGVFTRFSAVMAAIMVFSFYLAMPPLPGLPEAPGPEHSLIVNKNLIEVLALLAIASLPTGKWFGLDALLRGFFGMKKDAEVANA